MERRHTFNIGEYYHIYNRGNGKTIIFKDDYDYKRFMALLYLCNKTQAVDIRTHFREGRSFADLFEFNNNNSQFVDIGAYCLMPNHFHIFLREKSDGGISKFMEKVSTGYSMYFNKKYKRSGGLFEGRFKSQHVDNNSYFNYLFS